jgi:hypothetical protein
MKMLPYCHTPNDLEQDFDQNFKKKFITLFQWFLNDSPSPFSPFSPFSPLSLDATPYCFEQYVMLFLQSHPLPKDPKEGIDDLLRNYPIPNFPENIRTQFLQECRLVVEPLLEMEKEVAIQHLHQYSLVWDECNTNAHYVNLLLEWIPEAGSAAEWMTKLLKIFILGMLPNVHKRKKGKELQHMIKTHLYNLHSFLP